MRRERRKNFRLEWNATAAIRGLDGHLICLCVLSNFSNGGAKLITLDARAIPDQFLLVITPVGAEPANVGCSGDPMTYSELSSPTAFQAQKSRTPGMKLWPRQHSTIKPPVTL